MAKAKNTNPRSRKQADRERDAWADGMYDGVDLDQIGEEAEAHEEENRKPLTRDDFEGYVNGLETPNKEKTGALAASLKNYGVENYNPEIPSVTRPDETLIDFIIDCIRTAAHETLAAKLALLYTEISKGVGDSHEIDTPLSLTIAESHMASLGYDDTLIDQVKAYVDAYDMPVDTPEDRAAVLDRLSSAGIEPEIGASELGKSHASVIAETNRREMKEPSHEESVLMSSYSALRNESAAYTSSDTHEVPTAHAERTNLKYDRDNGFAFAVENVLPDGTPDEKASLIEDMNKDIEKAHSEGKSLIAFSLDESYALVDRMERECALPTELGDAYRTMFAGMCENAEMKAQAAVVYESLAQVAEKAIETKDLAPVIAFTEKTVVEAVPEVAELSKSVADTSKEISKAVTKTDEKETPVVAEGLEEIERFDEQTIASLKQIKSNAKREARKAKHETKVALVQNKKASREFIEEIKYLEKDIESRMQSLARLEKKADKTVYELDKTYKKEVSRLKQARANYDSLNGSLAEANKNIQALRKQRSDLLVEFEEARRLKNRAAMHSINKEIISIEKSIRKEDRSRFKIELKRIDAQTTLAVRQVYVNDTLGVRDRVLTKVAIAKADIEKQTAAYHKAIEGRDDAEKARLKLQEDLDKKLAEARKPLTGEQDKTLKNERTSDEKSIEAEKRLKDYNPKEVEQKLKEFKELGVSPKDVPIVALYALQNPGARLEGYSWKGKSREFAEAVVKASEIMPRNVTDSLTYDLMPISALKNLTDDVSAHKNELDGRSIVSKYMDTINEHGRFSDMFSVSDSIEDRELSSLISMSKTDDSAFRIQALANNAFEKSVSRETDQNKKEQYAKKLELLRQKNKYIDGVIACTKLCNELKEGQYGSIQVGHNTYTFTKTSKATSIQEHGEDGSSNYIDATKFVKAYTEAVHDDRETAKNIEKAFKESIKDSRRAADKEEHSENPRAQSGGFGSVKTDDNAKNNGHVDNNTQKKKRESHGGLSH
jgi:hypothetical protein